MPTMLEEKPKAAAEALRREALEAARHHKASWIRFGQILHAVHKDKLFKRWGFMTFEGYCGQELAIRQATAVKLLRSYQFLAREEPRLASPRLHGDMSPRAFPGVESVNVLRLAHANQKLTAREYEALRSSVMEEAKEPKDVRAEVRQLLAGREERDPRQLRRERRNGAIRRIISALANARKQFGAERLVPDSLLEQMSDLAGKLEAQIEAET